MKKALSAILALALAVTGLSACSDVPDYSATVPAETSDVTAAVTDKSSAAEVNLQANSLVYATDYAQVYANLSADSGYTYTEDGIVVEEAETSESDTSASYSSTNVQVDGIDEGDVVKTDGEYIYVLRDMNLLIFRASGADTAEVGCITVGVDYDSYDNGENEFQYKTPIELYVSGDRAAIISNDCSGYDKSDGNGGRTHSYSQRVTIDILDISDRTSPKIIRTFGQDGSLTASRMTGDKLYSVSWYSVYSADEDNPATYIPSLYEGDESYLLPCDCIAMPSTREANGFNILCEYDIGDLLLDFSESVLGNSGTVYMTADSLYIAGASYITDESEPYTEDVYTVTERSYGCVTQLTRYDLTGEKPLCAASCEITGYLNDQFSMDEYSGYLRLVMTEDNYTYTEYYDDERGFTNYDWGDEPTYNSLFILDSGLNTVGSINDLAEGETIYSARFDGDIGYFVTFETTDPLFAADLSDPTSPKVLSALKIPGFSSYLHVWSDGRLFGFGMSADEETGITDAVKLSMFDTTDPTDVTEKTTLLMDGSYSEATYNHKAILISPEKNLIGFPIEQSYEFYSYSNDTGFERLTSIDCGDSFWGARGLYIDSAAYIIGDNAITILDLDSLSLLASVDF